MALTATDLVTSDTSYWRRDESPR